MGTEIGIIRVAPRYCGPPTSANGGYVAGLVARTIGQLVTVRLLRPPLLDTDLSVQAEPDGTWTVMDGEQRIIEARSATIDLLPPVAPSYLEAVAASVPDPDPALHPCPGCYVCGPHRARGDGLRLYAGPVPGRDLVATGWVPDAAVGQADGQVAPEFIAAALDCPGFQALQTGAKPWLLGEYTCRIDRPVRVGEHCVIVGWVVETKGRRAMVATALYGEDGQCCALTRGTWIEPRPAD